MNKLITSPSFFIGKGDDELISFGSGQPDLPPPKEIFEILPEYKDFKYGLIQGQTHLREELAKHYPNTSSDNFVVTNGASEALDLVFRFIATKGGKILLPRPYYYSYPYIAEYAGLTISYYDLVDGKIDWNNFEKNLEGCTAVMINSPSNPTGSIQDMDILKKVEAITEDKQIYVISDEVYMDLIYERENYLIKGDHVITINSFSKTFAMCGFRIGYLYSLDREVVDACIAMKTHTSMNTSILGQEMAYEALKVPKSYLEEQVSVWKERRDLIYNGLVKLGLDLWKPEGAFYVFPKIDNPTQVVTDLYYDHKVIVYDGSWFGCPNRIRLSYALDIEKIEEGLSRIQTYISKNSAK